MKKRLDEIKAARSLNDIADIVSDIAYEFKNSSSIVKRLVASLSAEIVLDHHAKTTTKTAVKDDGYTAPKTAELKKHVDVIYRLYDNVVELDAAEAMIKQAFAGNKKQAAVLASIKALKADIDDSINDAFAALDSIATNHMPKQMAKMSDGIEAHLISSIKASSYKDIHRQVSVVPGQEDKTAMQFCEYFGVEALKDSKGYTYDVYYVVLTCVIDKLGNAQFYVNSFPDFKQPGKYPLGKDVKDLRTATKHVDILLSHNDFKTDHERQPLPFDTDRASTMGLARIKGVSAVSVKNDELLVKLAPAIVDEKSAAAQRVLIDVLARLNAVVGAKKNSKVFNYKFGTSAGAKAFKFILVPNVDKNAVHFSVDKMRDAAEVLGLTDAQQTALRFALQH